MKKKMLSIGDLVRIPSHLWAQNQTGTIVGRDGDMIWVRLSAASNLGYCTVPITSVVEERTIEKDSYRYREVINLGVPG